MASGVDPAHLPADPADGAPPAGPTDQQELSLSFPELPRLELDDLLAQLVERAQEVVATQGRLRGLLRANQAIIGDLALPVLLRRIVEAARTLVGARYAALGVIAPDGHLAEFVHLGMPTDAVERIGHLPEGKGLLGALIDDPRPIRLRQITADERSSGFPAGHPPMHSFLGVPIRVRDIVFGNLYLSESTKGEFSAEDEELAAALAATAGMVIDNARLFEVAGARQDWLRASGEITRELLSGEADDAVRPLRLIAEHCREVARAKIVTVVLPVPGAEELQVEVAVGPFEGDLTGVRVPLDRSLSGRVFASRVPLRVTSPDDPSLGAVTSGELDVGPVMVLPLLGSEKVHGVLTAARDRGRAAFTEEDLDMAAGFANQASVAIELAAARTEQQRVAMLDDRDRIAADLHDHVIQRLFGTGLSLHGIAATLSPGQPKERLMAAVGDIDGTISQIRTTIYQLGQAADPDRGLRGRLLDVVIDLTPTLAFDPAVRFAGVLEGTVPDEVADDLVAVLREALTNAARHAQARSATVSVTAGSGLVTLVVADDGHGIDWALTRRSGLANLRRRAEQHDGELEIRAVEPHGTELRWSARIS